MDSGIERYCDWCGTPITEDNAVWSQQKGKKYMRRVCRACTTAEQRAKELVKVRARKAAVGMGYIQLDRQGQYIGYDVPLANRKCKRCGGLFSEQFFYSAQTDVCTCCEYEAAQAGGTGAKVGRR